MPHVTPCLLAALLATTLAAAEPTTRIMQWVDADGVTHFGDRPPGAAQPVTLPARENLMQPVAPLPPTPPAKPRADEEPQARPDHSAECTRYQQRLEALRAQMRWGYRASQYNALMERDRSLRRKVAKYCRR